MSENRVFQVLGGNLQMVTHKNVLVDELPLKYDAGNHLGVITHKIAAFVSPIEHMFFGFIVIQSFPSFSETTRQKTLGRFASDPKKKYFRPNDSLRQGIKGMNPLSGWLLTLWQKITGKFGATHQDAEKSSTSCPTSIFSVSLDSDDLP